MGAPHNPAATRVPCSMARLASSSAATSAPPTRCTADAGGDQLVVEAPHRVLAGAQHHVVDGEHLRRPVDGVVQARVVDPVVGDAAQLDHPGLLEHRAVRPARRLAEPDPDRRGLALEQRDLADRGSAACARSARPGGRRGRRRPSEAIQSSTVSAGSWVRKWLTSTPMPPAPITATRFPGTTAPLSTSAYDTTDGWSMPSSSGVRPTTPVATTTSSYDVRSAAAAPRAEADLDAEDLEPAGVVAQRLAELLLARHPHREPELAAERRRTPRRG